MMSITGTSSRVMYSDSAPTLRPFTELLPTTSGPTRAVGLM